MIINALLPTNRTQLHLHMRLSRRCSQVNPLSTAPYCVHMVKRGPSWPRNFYLSNISSPDNLSTIPSIWLNHAYSASRAQRLEPDYPTANTYPSGITVPSCTCMRANIPVSEDNALVPHIHSTLYPGSHYRNDREGVPITPNQKACQRSPTIVGPMVSEMQRHLQLPSVHNTHTNMRQTDPRSGHSP